jgi:hypothetical protein
MRNNGFICVGGSNEERFDRGVGREIGDLMVGFIFQIGDYLLSVF